MNTCDALSANETILLHCVVGCFVLCLVYSTFQESLYCPFLIASNVCLHFFLTYVFIVNMRY